MEPISLEVDYDEDELSVSDRQAETTQAVHNDYRPSKSAAESAQKSNPVPPPRVEPPPEREPGEVLEEGEAPDDEDVEIVGSDSAAASVSPNKARNLNEKTGDPLNISVATGATESAWLRGVRAARMQLKQSRQRREQSGSGSNIDSSPAVGESVEEMNAPAAGEAASDEFGGDDGLVEDGDYLYDVYYSEAAGIKGGSPSVPQVPQPQRPLLPFPPGRAPFLPLMPPFNQPGFLPPHGVYRPLHGPPFIRPGYQLPLPPPGVFSYRPPPQPYPPPGGPSNPVNSERPPPADRPQGAPPAPMSGPPAGFPPATPPLRLHPPQPGSYPPAPYRPYDGYESYAPPPPGGYYPEEYGAAPHDPYAGHHIPVPYPPAHAVHHYPPAYEAEELDEFGRVRRRAPPPLPPRAAPAASPTRHRAARSRSNSASRRRPERAANKRARLSGSRSPRSSSSSSRSHSRARSRSRSSSASGRAMRRLQAVKSRAPQQQSNPASTTSLNASRGANAGRGRSPAGMSRSRATGAIGTTAKGFRNGRAAGRMSRENRSSSRSASRSSSSASSSSAADSDSPRKRRRVGDRRFDRYDDSDAERAARRTRRPRPLASVKDILAKTGDQAAFRSNKTPVKLTLSRNKLSPGSASAQSMPGSSGREMPSGTREGQPNPSAAAAGAGGEVQPSEERARQKMDKRAKLLEQLHQVESAIAKVKSRNPGSRPPSSTNTHRT